MSIILPIPPVPKFLTSKFVVPSSTITALPNLPCSKRGALAATCVPSERYATLSLVNVGGFSAAAFSASAPSQACILLLGFNRFLSGEFSLSRSNFLLSLLRARRISFADMFPTGKLPCDASRSSKSRMLTRSPVSYTSRIDVKNSMILAQVPGRLQRVMMSSCFATSRTCDSNALLQLTCVLPVTVSVFRSVSSGPYNLMLKSTGYSSLAVSPTTLSCLIGRGRCLTVSVG